MAADDDVPDVNGSHSKPSRMDALFDVRTELARRVPLERYARDVIANGVTAEVLAHLEAVNTVDDDLGTFARAALLREFLIDGCQNQMWQRSPVTQRAVLAPMYRKLPYYQTRIPERRALRPRRVVIESSVRVDLGMGGLSDLPPWTNEQQGCAVSMCATIDGARPIRCEIEVVDEPGLWLHAEQRSTCQRILEWEDLDSTTAPTAVLRAAVRHLVGETFRQAALDTSIAAVFGGGVSIRVSSSAPKGLGSSTIIASCITQGLLRLLGRVPEWEDVIHRCVAIERLVGVGGGWEDALPPFFGGVVRAESTPARLPVLKAASIELDRDFLDTLRDHLLLFDTEMPGYTGDILAEGTMRYIAGNADAIQASRDLVRLCHEVDAALRRRSLADLGELMTRQWELWKVITDGACTTPDLERLLAGANGSLFGAKPNGAGVGGAVLFAVRPEHRQRMIDYLSRQSGQLLRWDHDATGYATSEWFQAGVAGRELSTRIREHLQSSSRFESHGKVSAAESWMLSAAPPERITGPVNRDLFDAVVDAAMSAAAVASAVAPLIGTARPTTLRATKQLIDTTATAVFVDELQYWTTGVDIATAEAKDEYGRSQPGARATGRATSPLRVAVDVVDGTTPAAFGRPGAYSICAIADRLPTFPDLQAYAILAPAEALPLLDLDSAPEDAVEHNVRVIAHALSKRVDELTVVSHSADTGCHHETLIRRLEKLGVTVIVPDPVIVEPPYVAAACLGEASVTVDAMIGVFGLPEIAINTVLAGVLARGHQFIFRIASNRPLHERASKTLHHIFDFTGEELDVLASHGLRATAKYTYADLAQNGGVFAGVALTADDVLNIPGAAHDESITSVQGWLADPCGNAHAFRVRFERPADIDYPARYQRPLFDISLIVPLDFAEAGVAGVDWLEEIARELRHIVPGLYIQPRSDTRDGRVGLHVTLAEFIVEHFSTIASAKAADYMQNAIEVVAEATREMRGPMRFSIERVERTRTGVRALTRPDEQTILFAQRIAASGGDLFPDLNTTTQFHVTLARFTEIPTEPVIGRIDEICAEASARAWQDLLVRKAELRRATATPFRFFADHASFFIAD